MANTYLVTGGAGFIGSNIARQLVSMGKTVRVLDNFATGRHSNLAGIEDKIDLIEGDIANLSMAQAACEGVDYVLHQAALPSVPRSINDPLATNYANITGTLTMLTAARDRGVKRFVYAASSSAYGNAPFAVKTEDLPANPLSPYALTKYVGEVYARQFYDFYGLATISLRYFNVFGPYQDPKSQYAAVIPRFILTMLKGGSPLIYGDGNQSRDFTFVANNVAANIAAAGTSAGAGEMCNIACGDSVTLNELVQMLNEILGTDIKPIYQEARTGDVKHSRAGLQKAKRLFGYEPKISFKEGLKETVAWYKQNIN